MTDSDATLRSRSEFLRASALGAAGLGALSACASGAQAEKRKGFVVTVTHGPDDADRVLLALTAASTLPAGDNHVWFSLGAGILCRKGEAEKVSSPLFPKQGTAAMLLQQIREKGVAIHI